MEEEGRKNGLSIRNVLEARLRRNGFTPSPRQVESAEKRYHLLVPDGRYDEKVVQVLVESYSETPHRSLSQNLRRVASYFVGWI